MADFLASVDPLMPWHMTAFHPDYKMTEGYRRTTADDLMKIVEIRPGRPACNTSTPATCPARSASGKTPAATIAPDGNPAPRVPGHRKPRRR